MHSFQVATKFLLLASIICALVATLLNGMVMGKGGLGVAVLAPQENSSEWRAKVRLRRWSDVLAYAGLALAGGATVIEIIAELRR